MAIEENEFSDIISVSDPEKSSFDMKKSGEDQGLVLPYNGQDQKNTVLLPDQLGNLKYIFQDILDGNEEALKSPEFTSLNFNNIKAAIEWLAKTDSLNDGFKSGLISEGWRLNYKCKPPTPEEFLTTKYLGPTAETLHEPLKKAFCEFMNPLSPYRNAILSLCIGWGKSTLTAIINLYISVLFAMMWHPYKYFGLSSATVFVQALGAWSQKKGSEILLEPIRNIIESSPYFLQVRGHQDMLEANEDPAEIMDHIKWTTATKTAQPLDAKVYLANGCYKFMGDVKIGDKIASPTHGEVTVTAIPYKGRDMCYEVELVDLRKTQCNIEHLWYIKEGLEKNYKVVDLDYILKNYKKTDFFIFDNKKPTKIKTIRPIGVKDQQCIHVDAEDGLYITDEHIVTHNSALQMQNGVNYKLVSGDKDIIGMTLVGGSLTELAFFVDNGWSEDDIWKFFTKMRARIDSRMKGNRMGYFILDSSPNNLESVIDKWIWETAPKDPSNFILTGSRWKYFPSEFSQAVDENNEIRHDFETAFPLFTGGGGKPATVIETEEQLATYNPKDIIWCPLEQITSSGSVNFKSSAVENPVQFMRDLCGVPSGAADRIFYEPKVIEDAFNNNLKSVFSTIVAVKEEEPEHLIWNQVKDLFFNKVMDKYYYYYEPTIPRVASVDLAISGDTASIAVSHVEWSPTVFDDEGNQMKMYITDFVIPVIPKGGMINLDAFKFFIQDLITLGHMNIVHAGFDGFQSRSIMQSLERSGVAVELLSVDKTMGPYNSFVDYAFHRRWACGKNIMVKNNMLSLQYTKRKSGSSKVDHKQGKNVYTDSLCPAGALYNENAWLNSQVGYFAKDCTDTIVSNIALLDTYENDFVPRKVWNPGESLERSYDIVKNKTNILLNNMGLYL